MIVRISGEGQFSIDDMATAELNRLDSELEAAVNRNDEAAFAAALHGLLDQVRAQGSALPADTLEPSDLILPPEDASMDEVREMLTEEGLIPGLALLARGIPRLSRGQKVLSILAGNIRLALSVGRVDLS